VHSKFCRMRKLSFLLFSAGLLSFWTLNLRAEEEKPMEAIAIEDLSIDDQIGAAKKLAVGLRKQLR